MAPLLEFSELLWVSMMGLGLMDTCMVTDIDTDYETDFGGHKPHVFAEARLAHEVRRGLRNSLRNSVHPTA